MAWRDDIDVETDPVPGDNLSPRYPSGAAKALDLAWASDIAASRNDYVAGLGTALTDYSNATLAALKNYDTASFDAAVDQFWGDFNNERTYATELRSLGETYARDAFEAEETQALALVEHDVTKRKAEADYEAALARSLVAKLKPYVGPDFTAFQHQQTLLIIENGQKLTKEKSKLAEQETTANAAAKVAFFESMRQANTAYRNGCTIAGMDYWRQAATIDLAYRDAMNAADGAYDTANVRANSAFDEMVMQLDDRFSTVTLGWNEFSALSSPQQPTTDCDGETCFAAGTKVLMADGTTKNIEEIEVGDSVLAVREDAPDLPPTAQTVTYVFRDDEAPTWQLNFVSESGETLTVAGTGNHPFYVDGKGWINAEDLELGDECLSASGELMRLTAKEFDATPQPVYNLTVEDGHTFFVGEAEENSVLVHNECPTCHGNGILDTKLPGFEDRYAPCFCISDEGKQILALMKSPENYYRMLEILMVAQTSPVWRLNYMVEKGPWAFFLGPDTCHRWVMGTRDAIVNMGPEYYDNDEYEIHYITWKVGRDDHDDDHGGLVIIFKDPELKDKGVQWYLDNQLIPFQDIPKNWTNPQIDLDGKFPKKLDHPFKTELFRLGELLQYYYKECMKSREKIKKRSY